MIIKNRSSPRKSLLFIIKLTETLGFLRSIEYSADLRLEVFKL